MGDKKRLIAYDAVYQYAFDGVHGGGLEDEDFDAIINAIDAVPTIDAVEVVRCRDCIHRRYVDMGDEIGAIGGCGLFGTPMMTCNDFCSYGERRTDNGTT